MKNPYPKSKRFKTNDLGVGLPRNTKIQSGMDVRQPFVNAKPKGSKSMTSPAYATKTSNPRVKSKGGAKIAQGGEKEGSPSAAGLSRTNKGRQRL